MQILSSLLTEYRNAIFWWSFSKDDLLFLFDKVSHSSTFNWQHNLPKIAGLVGRSMRKSFLYFFFLIAGGSPPCLILGFIEPFNGLLSFKSILAVLVAVLDLIIFSHKTTAWTKVVFFLCRYCVSPSTQICRSHSLHRWWFICRFSQPGQYLVFLILCCWVAVI